MKLNLKFLFLSLFFILLLNLVSSIDTNTCKDTDGGKNYYIFGTTVGANVYHNSSFTYTDHCSGTYVVEGYCDENNSAYTTDFNCTYGCLDGVCINNTANNNTNNCTDSDGGKNYYSLGTVFGMHYGNSSWTFTDYCFTENGTDNWLLEGYCYNQSDAYTTDFLCSYDCVNGVCINNTANNTANNNTNNCTDSDGGKNYYIFGTTTGINISYIDHCSGTYVVEGYCDENNSAYTTDFNCTYGCLDGVCVNNLSNDTSANISNSRSNNQNVHPNSFNLSSGKSSSSSNNLGNTNKGKYVLIGLAILISIGILLIIIYFIRKKSN